MRSTTAAIPTAGRNTSRPSSRWRISRRKAGVEGHASHDSHAAHASDEGRDHSRAGSTLGVDYATTSCYDPDASGRRVRAVRRVPAATEGIRRSRRRPIRCAISRGCRRDVRRERDLLHAAGRRREHRTPRGVLSLRRVQPVDGSRSRSCRRRLPILRHGFRRRRGPGGGKFATADVLARAVAEKWPANVSARARRLVVCTGGEPLLQTG